MGKDFHSSCDNKGPTISLFQIKNGDCIGGFTFAEWSSNEKWDSKSNTPIMLFNLTSHTYFLGRYASIRNSVGPAFGLGESAAYSEPFNKENAISSNSNYSHFKIPCNSSGINTLTN